MIYFVQAGKNGPIKIGDSNDLHRRIELLQIGCPYKLNLLFVYNGRHFNESELHNLFKHENIRGEWFRPAKSIINFNKKYSDDCYPITNIDLYKCRKDMENIYLQRIYEGKR